MSNLDGYLIDEATAGINAPRPPDDAGKLAVVNAEGDNLIYVAPETVVGALAPPAADVTHYSDDAVTRQTFDSIGAALEATYEAGTVVVDLRPNLHDVEPGPVTITGPAFHLIRGTAGRDSVRLPELVRVPEPSDATPLTIEACTIESEISFESTLTLRDVASNATIAAGDIEARDSAFGSDSELTVSGHAYFDRCSFAFEAEITATPFGGNVRLTNCEFAAAITITFTIGGVVRMDTRTKFLWDASGSSVVNGTITVEA